jgi:hypothetical protein
MVKVCKSDCEGTVAETGGRRGCAETEAGPDGRAIGRDPRKMGSDELRTLGHAPMAPTAAIRAHCLDCCGGSSDEVRKCTAPTSCRYHGRRHRVGRVAERQARYCRCVSASQAPELNGLHSLPWLGDRVGGARGIGQGTEGRLLANKLVGSHEVAPGTEAGPDGRAIGRDPRKMGSDELRTLGHAPMAPTAAIRAHCLDCCGGSSDEVRKCTAVRIGSWCGGRIAPKIGI